MTVSEFPSKTYEGRQQPVKKEEEKVLKHSGIIADRCVDLRTMPYRRLFGRASTMSLTPVYSIGQNLMR